ncbi:starch synthase [Tranquillimonas rosea]|uniref:Glycogen synthase n=1 Tax=Tranquillimonas rosea TaxID=641238 RepID=A0A1H9VGA0_9RHOB|nr:glycogen synthase GlgA [Tranquillimonas rosea]SES20705.1 starch synthase [Tranquillimonas rosea]
MIPVLSVASECAPLIKTGGLADVVGALPHALAAEGIETRVMLPGYPSVMTACAPGDPVMEEAGLFGGAACLRPATYRGLSLYILDAPHLFAREGSIYLDAEGEDWPDNPERFAALSWMGARLAAEGGEDGWVPRVLHCHDWQAGFAPLYLREMGAAERCASVMTVHNIAFHGFAPAERRHELRLPEEGWRPEGYEYWGRISALKAGLTSADRITTVSPTYAAELTTQEFGMGLEGVISERSSDLAGILNGIDLDAWNPATDPAILTYKTHRGKARNRAALRAELGLYDSGGPLAVVVSRLTHQKGLDLLLEALPEFLEAGGQLGMLGSGDRRMEVAWQEIAAEHPNVAVRIGYDEALAHRLIAGGDAILVPSRFEPCGLTQLYGLRYGTVPVVAQTGGLADTVISANDAALRAGVATGLTFSPVTAPALGRALSRVTALFADHEVWGRIQRNAMRHPVGWDVSAAAYAALYHDLLRDK